MRHALGDGSDRLGGQGFQKVWGPSWLARGCESRSLVYGELTAAQRSSVVDNVLGGIPPYSKERRLSVCCQMRSECRH